MLTQVDSSLTQGCLNDNSKTEGNKNLSLGPARTPVPAGKGPRSKGSSLSKDDEKGFRSRNYVFTWFNYPKTFDSDLIYCFTKTGDPAPYYGYQEEICPSTKNPHIQGYVCFNNQRWNTALYKIIPAKWALMHGTKDENITYVTKGESRKPGGLGRVFPSISKLDDPLEGQPMRPFQEEIKAFALGKADKRTIYWIYSKKGGIGKSAIVNWLEDNYEHCIFRFDTTSAKDVKFVLKTQIKLGNSIQCLLFDFCRDEKLDKINYKLIESAKNGRFLSTKYEPFPVKYNATNVICIANGPPRRDAMSDDRWQIFTISDDFQLVRPTAERDRPAAHPGMNVVERFSYPEC